MNTNQEMIEKATVTSGNLQSQGGYLSPAQADKFIKQVFDATVLFPEVRKITMKAAQQEINNIYVGDRIMRKFQTENEDQSSYSKNVQFGSITLTAEKYSLPWQISEEALEDSIEGKTLEQTLVEHFTKRIGLDLEDLALNGAVYSPSSTTLSAGISDTDLTIPVADTTGFPEDSDAGYLLIDSELIGYGDKDSTNFLNAIRGDGPTQGKTTAASHTSGTAVAWSPHPLIGQSDGWVRLAETSGANLKDMSGVDSGNLSKTTFFEMERLMPTQYIRGAAKRQLRWILSYRQYINWQEYLANQTANRGYDVLAGTEFWPLGIPMITATSMTSKKMMLTWPKNLIFGIWRQLKIKKAMEDKDSIMQDMRFYNATVRCTQEIERPDAVVLAYNLTGDPKP